MPKSSSTGLLVKFFCIREHILQRNVCVFWRSSAVSATTNCGNRPVRVSFPLRTIVPTHHVWSSSGSCTGYLVSRNPLSSRRATRGTGRRLRPSRLHADETLMMSPLRTESSFSEPRFLGLIRGAAALPGCSAAGERASSFSPHPPNAPFHSFTQTTVKPPCAPSVERDRDRASVDGLVDIGRLGLWS
jgi:hypothetical protein